LRDRALLVHAWKQEEASKNMKNARIFLARRLCFGAWVSFLIRRNTENRRNGLLSGDWKCPHKTS